MFLPGDTVGVQQKVLKPWRDLRMKQKKNDTLFKAWTKKSDIQFNEKQKQNYEWYKQVHSTSLLW